MRKTTLYKIIASLSAFFLVCNLSANFAFAKTIEQESIDKNDSFESLQLKANNENIYNKIHFYFEDSSNTTIDDATELIEATQKISDRYVAANSMPKSSTNVEEIKITVQFESDFMDTAKFKSFAAERETLDSIEEIRNFRQRLNSYSKEYHNAIMADNIDQLSKFEYNSLECMAYSPYATVSIDANKISADSLTIVAESEDVVSISVAPEEQMETDDIVEENTQSSYYTSWDTMLKGMHAYNIVANGTYTGEGIRVGILEGIGVCDVDHVNLADKNITVFGSPQESHGHATLVTSVAALIAPDAEFYVCSPAGGYQWLLDNYCDIINCSWGRTYNPKAEDGTYIDGVKEYRLDIDGLYDYLVLAHFITVVKSSGNYNNDHTNILYNPQKKVTNPGYAYNVITVGGVCQTSPDTGGYVVHSENACYVTTPTRAKPNISSFSRLIIPNMDKASGTSLSAPAVTGCIALLEESNLNYVVYPERIMAVLMATANMTNDYSEDIGGFSDKVGAGVIDLQEMIDSNLYYSTCNTNGTSRSEVKRINISMERGEKLQVGLSWFVTAVNTSTTDINISNVLLTDYDLRIYSSSGALVKSSALVHSNTEMIRYTATENDVYTIVIYQYSSIARGNEGDWIGLSYNVTD